jgi:hypothetical protein
MASEAARSAATHAGRGFCYGLVGLGLSSALAVSLGIRFEREEIGFYAPIVVGGSTVGGLAWGVTEATVRAAKGRHQPRPSRRSFSASRRAR